MPEQTSFEDRLARIAQQSAAQDVPPQTSRSADPVRRHVQPQGISILDAVGHIFSAARTLYIVFVMIALGASAFFWNASPDTKISVISVFIPEFGQVASDEAAASDRYESGTKVTPFNANRLALKRMNAFAQDESEWEMRALIKRANDLGQPFLAKEIAREMGACETLKCRSTLKTQYDTQLKQLRKSTPTW
ncbi:hypothetical protein [uncultured Tateyamaria sp.]|uniref:hypothetical protein n=1 Tax=Tateyamaria sp. 1078 TaxID=3417464 RepID=UPI00261459F4|nr:hypothetical protein [uncultured Tateyamaria sp.]